MPKEIIEIEKTNYKEAGRDQPIQSVEEIMRIIQEAKMPGEATKVAGQSAAGASDPDDMEDDIESEIDASGDYMSHDP